MSAARDVSYEDTLGDALKDPAGAAAYIEAVMELDDPATLLVARRAEVGDETLFKALSVDGNPTLATVYKVLHAVGLRLSVVPEHT
jgi:DNA-binding phage protein